MKEELRVEVLLHGGEWNEEKPATLADLMGVVAAVNRH